MLPLAMVSNNSRQYILIELFTAKVSRAMQSQTGQSLHYKIVISNLSEITNVHIMDN